MTFANKMLADVAQLIKLRLSLIVVFSASMAYLWACNRQVDVLVIWLLSAGGFLITASSNILNQILEKNSDCLMKRTAFRPIPAGRMEPRQALALALILGICGLFLLSQISQLCTYLGLSAIVLYALVYTPLKKVTSFVVIPGALAGSLPVLIGTVAATGKISEEGVILFLFQFIWQFPHTWTIAWLLNEEYSLAGLKMLPFSQKSKSVALLILASTFLLLPSCLLLYMYGMTGILAVTILFIGGLSLLVPAFRLFNQMNDKSAVALMLGCLAFLPFALILLVLEKFVL